MENLDRQNNKNVSLSLISEYGCSDSDTDDTDSQIVDSFGDDSEEPVELSAMVLKNNIINACAHGPLASTTGGRDDVETTRTMIIDSTESGVVEYEVTEYRDIDSDSDTSSSSDSSDSDVDSVKDIEINSSSDDEGGGKTEMPAPPRVRGELSLDDLPPIEDLAISLPAQETEPIGKVASIVDKLVTVRAMPGTPAVDLDSVLFLDKGAKPLGKVFDVFGPVTEPYYCVRFNSNEHVKEKGIEPGMDVYIAPKSDHTNYVFLSELMRIKGSDASWRDDVEPPPSQLDYSDDEEEQKANRAKKEKKKQESDNAEENAERRKSQEVRRNQNQRPSESSSRFGSGPSNRNRNPFSTGFRRNYQNLPRFRLYQDSFDLRTPPPHVSSVNPFSAPPTFSPNIPPLFPPPFTSPYVNPRGAFQFNRNPRFNGVPMGGPFRPGFPMFGMQAQWANGTPPPPPGT
ncbi:hypothetical protein EVAR_76313_1 [Eumeta japonica]|uniref:H/ACA ribonucleoprotein complex non-core subunit NAF1 n=1 Tax=Eumeta variegata TaxID=151549 RepID=A0A4C1T8E5_EUMVA|nr:hypothetical protein EVAR_76313_1 [Eumeta japonica]